MYMVHYMGCRMHNSNECTISFDSLIVLSFVFSIHICMRLCNYADIVDNWMKSKDHSPITKPENLLPAFSIVWNIGNVWTGKSRNLAAALRRWKCIEWLKRIVHCTLIYYMEWIYMNPGPAFKLSCGHQNNIGRECHGDQQHRIFFACINEMPPYLDQSCG